MKYLSIVFVLAAFIGQAQKSPFGTPIQSIDARSHITHRTCGFEDHEHFLQGKLKDRLSTEAFEKKLALHMAQHHSERITQEEIYRIPVVVHVIHNGEAVGSGSNISQAQVQSQIDVLNEDFRRTGAGFNSHPDGSDTNIEFFLASTDPDGNTLSEPGINRVNGGVSAWTSRSDIENSLKPQYCKL